MNFGVTLNETDLREMPPELRDHLLKWYFGRPPSGNGSPSPRPADPDPPAVAAVPRRTESGRVSFQEFVRAGLLSPGNEVVCRTLKAQQRRGGDRFIEAGKVLADGSVEYRGRRYDVPSRLAVTVINTSGGKTEALNGYDYLFVRSSTGMVPLSKLRDKFLKATA